MWVTDPGCYDIVKNAWSVNENGSLAFALARKLKNTMNSLIRWNNDCFGNIPNRIKNLNQDLENIQRDLNGSPNGELMHTERNVRNELERLLEMEEIQWAQRAHQLWLLLGDRNTKYFHTVVRKRRISNCITRLQDDEGNWYDQQEDLEKFILCYYKHVFEFGDEKSTDEILGSLNNLCFPCLSTDDCSALMKEVDEEEVKRAIFEMKPFKVPGPDGLPAVFFQTYWEVVKDDIIKMIRSFFARGFLLKELNYTDIALIPKVENPTLLKNFRPISLCNVCYKIISKLLANRLKPLMEKLISPFQSAFVKGRQINDNIFLTSELMTSIHKARKLKTHWGALKLDMAKAYDRMSWNFILAVMRKMGFPEQFSDLLLQCVSTTSFNLLLNGQRIGQFSPQRGLRQGDPLSPFLFILCSNVLSLMLIKAEQSKEITGIRYARSGPMISHLMYADDTILFFQATHSSCEAIKNILHSYCDLSGQKVNYDKSLAVFSPNTPRVLKEFIAEALGVSVSNSIGKYLGVFVDGANVIKRNGEGLLERLDSRLRGWKASLLS